MQAARGTPIAQPSATDLTRGRQLRWLFVGVALAGLVVDVLTKVVVVAQLEPYQPVRLLGELLMLRLIRNPGAAFSLGENFTIVFALLSVLVLGFVVIRLVPRLGHPGWAVALGLLCAGVSGNLTDRIFRTPGALRGHVVDFLQLPYWPIFNVADMCISGAATLIIILSVVKNVGLDGVRYTYGSKAKTAPKPAVGSGQDEA